jgi:hypothetical protein
MTAINGIIIAWYGINMPSVKRRKIVSQYLNLIFDKTKPFTEPIILENIVAKLVKIKLFIMPLNISLEPFMKASIVGFEGGTMGIDVLTSTLSLNAVVKTVQNGNK